MKMSGLSVLPERFDLLNYRIVFFHPVLMASLGNSIFVTVIGTAINMPVFSPTAYAGQNVSFSLKVERYNGESIIIQPYVHDSNKDVDVKLGGQVVVEDGWMDVSFVIPALDGDLCDEIGFVLEGNSPEKCKDFGVVLLTDFSITGNADYSINLVRQKKEFGSVGGFSHNHGDDAFLHHH